MVITIVLGILLSISELLALNPAIKSNGIFQLLVNFIKTLRDNFKSSD